MKFRKHLLSAVAIAAIASTTLLPAQEERKRGGGGGRGMSPEAQIERIENAVGKLSDEQKKKITAIYGKMSEKMRAAGPDNREKMAEVFQEVRKEVRAVLTPEQQKKYDEMAPRGGGGGGGGRKKQN